MSLPLEIIKLFFDPETRVKGLGLSTFCALYVSSSAKFRTKVLWAS